MTINSTFKKLIIATAVVAMVVVAFLVYSLAGLGASPVTLAAPPAFVEQYASKFNPTEISPLQKKVDRAFEHGTKSILAKWTRDYFNEAALVRNVILNGESPDKLLRLFTHPEKEKRVKIAFAFAAVNTLMSHDDGSGFPEKRQQFWVDVEEHIPDIQNAIFEALIVSAEEGTPNYIPYTLAWWMPGQEHKTVEVLAWAAKHHPDSWVRRFSVFFVVEHGQNEEIASQLLQDRTHDPVFKVRKTVLDQRFRRFIGD